MKNHYINHIFAFLVLSVLLGFSAHAVFAFDITGAPVNLGVPKILGNNAGNLTASGVVRFAINLLIIIGIVASLIFLLWGGLRWIMSGGDKAKVDAARGTIVAAIVGLIIVILAWVIINTVLQVLTGCNLGTFTLPTLNGAESGCSTASPTPTP